MKLIYSLALLLALGCASKPKPGSGITVSDIYWISGCPLGFATDINFETGAYSCDGSISHVTREQWEAAQGLYNPKRVRGIKLSGTWGSGAVFTCAGCTASTDPGILFSTSAGTTAVAHFKKPRLCPRDEHRALIDIPIQREGVACAGTAISDCAEHHVIDVCEKNHDPFGDTFPPAGDAK